MVYAFLMLGITLLVGIVRLTQALRLSIPLLYGVLVITVFRPWYLTHTALADCILDSQLRDAAKASLLLPGIVIGFFTQRCPFCGKFLGIFFFAGKKRILPLLWGRI